MQVVPNDRGPAPSYYEPRRRKVWPLVVGTVAFLLLGLVAVLGFVSPGWFVTGIVDAEAAEADVRASIANGPGAAVHVSCPDGEPEEAGHVFTCTVFVAEQALPVRVTVPEDEEPPYRVQADNGRVLDAPGVEQGVVTILGSTSTVQNVSCPEGQKVVTGHQFECTATVDGQQKTIKITVVDAEADPPKYEVGNPE